MVEQAAVDFDHVANRNGGKIAAVRFAGSSIGAAGTGCAAADAEEVGTNDEIAVRINRFARPDDDVPPAGIVLVVVAGGGGGSAGGGDDGEGGSSGGRNA